MCVCARAPVCVYVCLTVNINAGIFRSVALDAYVFMCACVFMHICVCFLCIYKNAGIFRRVVANAYLFMSMKIMNACCQRKNVKKKCDAFRSSEILLQIK